MITLKEHQEYVVEQAKILIQQGYDIMLRRVDGKRFALTIQAPTGSGKTVIISEIILEILNGLYESEENGTIRFGAILFASASPELNAQTIRKIERMYPALRGKIRLVDANFKEERLEPGYIYFINTQKLGANGILSRGDKEGSTEYNLWKVIDNARRNIENPLALIIDESHQGMGGKNETIVKRLIQGRDDEVSTPIVIGMSATPSKFVKFIKKTHFLEEISVSLKEVKDSGLLKQKMRIFCPDKDKGDFTSQLFQVAAEEYVMYESAWSDYCTENNIDVVIPAMLVQVKNHVKEEELVEYARILSDNIPSLGSDSFAHNISGMPDLITGQGMKIYQVDPSDVQDDNNIQIFFIKESAMTGWDCPRAEILLSFRPHSDSDYIAQAAGRPLRNPLAMTIEGNDILNSVSLVLLNYDISQVEKINDQLKYGFSEGYSLDDEEGIIESVINPVTVSPVDDSYIEVLESIPSFTRPSMKRYNPVNRYRDVGFNLSQDDIIKDHDEEIFSPLVKKIIASMYRFNDALQEGIKDLQKVSMILTESDLSDEGELVSGSIERDYNEKSLQEYYKYAERIFTSEITRLAVREYISEQDCDVNDAFIALSAAANIDSIVEEVYEYCDNNVRKFIKEEYDDEIRMLNNTERQAEYRKLLEQSHIPEESVISLPDKYTINKKKIKNGVEEDIYAIENEQHIFADEEGNYYFDADNLEASVLDYYLPKFKNAKMYRNPSSGAKAIGVPYEKDGEMKVFYPDFFFVSIEDEKTSITIIDPHSTHLEDSLPKLQGLVRYIEDNQNVFNMVKSISEIDKKDNTVRTLELTEPAVRDHILNSKTINEAYEYNGIGAKKIKLG